MVGSAEARDPWDGKRDLRGERKQRGHGDGGGRDAEGAVPEKHRRHPLRRRHALVRPRRRREHGGVGGAGGGEQRGLDAEAHAQGCGDLAVRRSHAEREQLPQHAQHAVRDHDAAERLHSSG